MDVVENIRCLVELILPVFAWLARIFTRDQKAGTAGSGEPHQTLAAPTKGSPVPRSPLDPNIEHLQNAGDVYGLLTVLHVEKEPVLRLEAADALARMGNEEGLDYLIQGLDAHDADESDAAREILEDLDLPRGNEALQKHPVAEALLAAPSYGQGEGRGSAQLGPAVSAAVSGDPWSAYFDKQISMEGKAARNLGQPVVVGTEHPATGSLPDAGTRLPRWLKDFWPGAVGALLVTLGVLAFGFFADLQMTAEDKQGGLFIEVICLPVTLAIGAVSGALASLVVQAIGRAVRLRDRAQRVTSTIVGLISGAASGLFCDGFFLIAAYI
jgi:hypothetical protein